MFEADPITQQGYLSTAEAAKRMGVSKDTVRRLCQDGVLAGAAKKGDVGPWRIPIGAAEAWASAQTPKAVRESAETDPARISQSLTQRVAALAHRTIGRLWQVIRALGGIVAVLALVSVLANVGGAQQRAKIWGKQLGVVHDFSPAKNGEILIVIASFYNTEGIADTDAHNEIRRAIEKARDEEGFQQLRIGVETTRLAADDRRGAEALGKRYNASVVIWGADTGIRVTVNFLNLKSPGTGISYKTVTETEKTQLVSPGAYQQFVVRYLPAQLTFFSLLALSQSYIASAQYSDGMRAFEKALAVSPVAELKPEQAAEDYFHLGWLRQHFGGELPEAIRDYDEALRRNPAHSGAYVNRGTARRALGDVSGAVADYTEAIRLNANDILAYYNRANARAQMDDLVGAIADYDRVIGLDSKNPAAYFARAGVRSKRGDLLGAIADYDYVISLNDNDASAYLNRGVARQKLGNLPSATHDFSQAIKLNPSFAEAYSNLGQIKYLQGDYAGAIIDFDDAIRINPALSNAYSGRGTARYAAGYVADALADYNHALQIDPTSVETLNNRAVLRREQGDPTGALADLDEAIRLRPEHASAYANRGTTRFRQGDFAGAMTDFRRYLELRPNAPDRSQVEVLIADSEGRLSKQ